MMDTTRVAKAIRQQADEMGSVLQELERLRAQVDELRTRYAHLERKAAEDAKRYTEMLAALTAERDAARAELLAAEELHLADETDIRLLEGKLAQTWQPVGAADPDIVCEHGTLVQAHGTSIAIGQQVTPDSDELVWTVAELPDGYALCTRQEPPA